jgi:hypothetical protein
VVIDEDSYGTPDLSQHAPRAESDATEKISPFSARMRASPEARGREFSSCLALSRADEE